MSELNETDKMVAIACTTFIVFIFGLITILLAVYGYKNPDSEECWVVLGLDAPAPSKTAIEIKAATMGVPITEGYPVNMAKVYRTWFIWGFWSKIYLVVMALFFGGLSNFLGKFGQIVGNIACGLYAVHGLVWIVVGAVWRYSNDGSVAAGDFLERQDAVSDESWAAGIEASRKTNGFQYSSGTFIHLYVVGVCGMITLSIVVSIILSTATCMLDPSDEKAAEEIEETD